MNHISFQTIFAASATTQSETDTQSKTSSGEHVSDQASEWSTHAIHSQRGTRKYNRHVDG